MATIGRISLMAMASAQVNDDNTVALSFGVTTAPEQLSFAELAYLMQTAKMGMERALVAIAAQATKAGPEWAAEFRKGIDAAVANKDKGEEEYAIRMSEEPVWVGGAVVPSTTPSRKREPER